MRVAAMPQSKGGPPPAGAYGCLVARCVGESPAWLPPEATLLAVHSAAETLDGHG
jgi:hypothetical protein